MNILAITNPLLTFTTVLPPVYYPLSAVPEELRLVCLLIPTTAMSELRENNTNWAFVRPYEFLLPNCDRLVNYTDNNYQT